MSCDPTNLISHAFMQICERIDIWEEKANEIGATSILGQAIKDAASSLIKNSPQDGFHFDLDMIASVGKRLEAQTPEIKNEFARFVHKVSNYYEEIMNNLPTINNNEIIQKAQHISTSIRTVAHEVETWARGVNDVVGIATKLPFPKQITNLLQDIGTISNHVQNATAHIGDVIDSLWSNTQNTIKQTDDLSNKAKDLRSRLSTATSEQKVKIETELKAIESQLSRQTPSLENTLSGIKAGFQAAGIIAGLFGKSQLANDIAAIGEAAVTITGSLATLIAGSAMGGPAMPVIAIAGAVAMLASHFFGSGSAQREDVILKSINKLSKHMDERFDRIELIIQKSVQYLAEHIDRRFIDLGNHMDKRFDRIEETLNYMYKEMLGQFAKLHEHQADQLQAIQQKLDGLRQAIDYLHTDMAQNMVNLYEQSYLNHKTTALRKLAREEITPEKHRKHYQAIVEWVKTQVKSDTMSGNEITGDLADRIRASGMNLYINKIRQKAIELGIPDLGRLVNPAAWADGVRTLTAYFALTPKLYEYLTPNNVILENIQEIKNEGIRVRNFIHSIQINEKVFNDLINQYKSSLMQVMNTAYDLTVVTDPANPIGTPCNDVNQALMFVTAIEACDTFITREIYPSGRGIPDLARPESIAQNNYHTHDFPGSAILKEIAGQFACRLRDDRAYHNDSHRNQCYAAYRGEITDGFIWAMLEPSNNGAVIHHWNNIKNHYDASYNEATALRNACTDLRNFIRDSHLNTLATDANYRRNRISAILSHHAMQEKIRAATARDLPHYGLMKKYFSIKDLQQLNTILRAHAGFNIQLDNLQKAYEELSIFIAFAFPKQFAGDPNLRAFLDRLWDKQDVLNYIAPTLTESEFVSIALQDVLEPQGELNAFSRFILTYVADAKLAFENNIDNGQYDHPLIKKVLHELEDFEKIAILATKIPAPVAVTTRVYHHLGSYDEIDTGSNPLFSALAKQICFVTKLACEPLTLENKAQQANENAEIILDTLAKSEDLEIIVIDESIDKSTQIKAWNLGGKHTVHLLRTENQAWYSFYPSESCQKRPDYLAARLMTTASNTNSAAQIEDLQRQLNQLTEMLANLTVTQNMTMAANAVNPKTSTATFSYTPTFWPTANNTNSTEQQDNTVTNNTKIIP